MKIALLQLNPIIGDLKGNAEKIKKAAQIAADRGARLIVTPELVLMGYPPQDLLLYHQFIKESQKVLIQLAHQCQNLPPLLIGTVILNNSTFGKPLYNAAAFLKQGQIKNYFCKTLL